MSDCEYFVDIGQQYWDIMGNRATLTTGTNDLDEKIDQQSTYTVKKEPSHHIVCAQSNH